MKILFQNRKNTYLKPGGDTVVMENIKEHLEKAGDIVQFSSETNINLSKYDIVHIFNLTLQSLADQFTKNAVNQKKPIVVTSLQENFPLYFSKAQRAVVIFKKYLEHGQSKEFFDKSFDLVHASEPSKIYTAPFTLAFADMHFACSTIEKTFIESFFPRAPISVVPFGVNIKHIESSGTLFEEEFNIKDFVLCVGRLEARKNQLMLLKALEDEDVPLVFVDGGFTYSDEYRQLCMNFKRKGKTIFTGRLSDHFLVSAYKAARVHCLPSWYELPGLVTLEAARYGCQVIASSWGAISDYMKDSCTYCQPDDYNNINNAVMDAYRCNKTNDSKIQAEKYTWEETAKNTSYIYKKVICHRNVNSKKCSPKNTFYRKKCWCNSDLTESVHEMYGTCISCGTLVLKRKISVNDLEKFYKDSYWTTFMESNYNKPPIQDRAVNDFYDRIPFYYHTLTKYVKKPKSILEIGCSHGGFLYYCLKNGIPEITGVEIDIEICAFAKNQFDLQSIVQGMFPSVSLPKDFYDVIVCFDVLEHFLDPVGTLKAVSEKLTDNGICFFVTPAYRGETNSWDRFRVDEHLFLYNEVSVSALAHQANIEIVDIFPSLYNQDMIIIGKKRQHSITIDSFSTLGIPYHDYSKHANLDISQIRNKKKKNQLENKPLISVLFIIEKESDTVQKSFNSLLNQLYENIEIIIVANNSSQFINKFISNIPDNKNISVELFPYEMVIPTRLNKIVKKANGKYIAFLTEHSAFYINHFYALEEAINKAGIDAVYSDTFRAGQIKQNGKYVTIKREYIFENTFNKDLLLVKPTFPIFSTLISKDSFLQNNGFNERYTICYDWEFWIRYCKNNSIIKIPKITNEYFFRNDNSIITDKMRSQFLLEKKMIAKTISNSPHKSLLIDNNQFNRIAIDMRPTNPFPTLQDFMDRIIYLVENKRLSDAKIYYTKHRKFLPPVSDLLKFDSIIQPAIK